MSSKRGDDGGDGSPGDDERGEGGTSSSTSSVLSSSEALPSSVSASAVPARRDASSAST